MELAKVDWVVRLLRMVLKFNVFVWGNHYYQQDFGTAIGTSCAPPYSGLFMEELTNEAFRLWRVDHQGVAIPNQNSAKLSVSPCFARVRFRLPIFCPFLPVFCAVSHDFARFLPRFATFLPKNACFFPGFARFRPVC